MKYPSSWKSRGVHLDSFNGIVNDRNNVCGQLRRGSRHMGRGMRWIANRAGNNGSPTVTKEFKNKLEAIAFILGENVEQTVE